MADCFNLNFSNPGGTAPFQSLLLSPKQECSSDELAAAESDGSKESTPAGTMNLDRPASTLLPNGKKTKGRVKIKMEYIGNKLRRYTTFSKRKTGIMKKAQELSTLTGTQVMLLVASETGHVYAFATDKLKPMIEEGRGRALIEECLRKQDRPLHECEALKTEFSFDGPSGSLSNVNPRKRKLQQDFTETLSIPTMVASASPMESYNDSDNDSNDDGLAEEEVSVEDKSQILKEFMRAASENKQRQKRKESAKKTNENALASLLTNCDQVNLNNILPLILSGLSSSPCSSSLNSPPQADKSSPLDAVAAGTSTRTEPGGQVVFQMPQGVVYTNPDASLESHSTTASPQTSNPDPEALQQLFSMQFGQNIMQTLLSSLTDSHNKT